MSSGGDARDRLAVLEAQLRQLEHDLTGRAPVGREPQPAPASPPAAEPADPVAARLAALRERLDGLEATGARLRAVARAVVDEHGRALVRLERAAAAAERAVEAASGRAPEPFSGLVVVEAGPFSEPDALRAFRQSLEAAPGARDVYLRSLADGRALLEVELAEP